MSHPRLRGRLTGQTNRRIRGSRLGTLSKVQPGTSFWLRPRWLCPDLTPARQSCPSQLSHGGSPKIAGDIHDDVPTYPLISWLTQWGYIHRSFIFFIFQFFLSLYKGTQTLWKALEWNDESHLNLTFPSNVTPLQQVFTSITVQKCGWTCLNTTVGLNLFTAAITVLTVIVLLGCWLTWLLVFVQRGKEELREATALLTAQQTSLEIIVNMCCSDGECCGHGQQCWPRALSHQRYSLWRGCPVCVCLSGKAIKTRRICEMSSSEPSPVVLDPFYLHVPVQIRLTTSGRRSRAATRATWARTASVMECPILCLHCVCQLRSTRP